MENTTKNASAFLTVILSGVCGAKDLAIYYRRWSLNPPPINTGVLSFNKAQR